MKLDVRHNSISVTLEQIGSEGSGTSGEYREPGFPHRPLVPVIDPTRKYSIWEICRRTAARYWAQEKKPADSSFSCRTPLANCASRSRLGFVIYWELSAS